MLVRCLRRIRQKIQHRGGDLLAAMRRHCTELSRKRHRPTWAAMGWAYRCFVQIPEQQPLSKAPSIALTTALFRPRQCGVPGVPGVLLPLLLSSSLLAMVQPSFAQPVAALTCEQATRNYQAVNGAPVREPRTVELAWRDVQRVCGAASSAEPQPQQYVGPASTDPRPVAPKAPLAPMAPTGSNFSHPLSPLK